MKVGYISDVHTELPCLDVEFDFYDVLCLCGDIGNIDTGKRQLLRFLKKCKEHCRHLIYISGNHEYWNYHSDTWFADEEYSDLCRENDIFYLLNSSVEIEGVTFYGGTMWTCDGTSTPSDRSKIREFKFYSTDLNRGFLKNAEEVLNEEKAVILSHHCPLTGLSKNGDEGFASHCYLLDKYQDKIIAWVYGHTHERRITKYGIIPVMTNAAGYKNELYSYSVQPMVFNI